MSSEDSERPTLPVSGLFSELSAGGDATYEIIANRLITSDKDLAIKCRSRAPKALMKLEILEADARSLGYTQLADFYLLVIKSYRENSLGEGGYAFDKMVEVLKAHVSAGDGDKPEKTLLSRGGK